MSTGGMERIKKLRMMSLLSTEENAFKPTL